MYYLKSVVKEIFEDKMVIETNSIGYKGYRIFNSDLEIGQEMKFFVINYKNEYINEFLFFTNKETRDIAEDILNIKNIGVNSIKKIFTNLNFDEFKKNCQNHDVESMIKKTKLSETICKKVILECRTKLFNEKYNLKQMNVINALNKLGYKISDIYRSMQKIDFNLTEEIILESVILNLNSYGN